MKEQKNRILVERLRNGHVLHQEGHCAFCDTKRAWYRVETERRVPGVSEEDQKKLKNLADDLAARLYNWGHASVEACDFDLHLFAAYAKHNLFLAWVPGEEGEETLQRVDHSYDSRSPLAWREADAAAIAKKLAKTAQKHPSLLLAMVNLAQDLGYEVR